MKYHSCRQGALGSRSVKTPPPPLRVRITERTVHGSITYKSSGLVCLQTAFDAAGVSLYNGLERRINAGSVIEQLELGMPEFTVYKDRYIWNNEKNELNQKKHGISFEEAAGVFDDPFSYEVFDEDNSLDEDRYRVTGAITGFVNGRFVTVSVTYRDELIRIFSARDAEPAEIEGYNDGVKSILG
jgi:uncharacterized DUF497 family protein